MPRIPNLPREEWTHEAREVFSFWGEPGSYENGSKTNSMMAFAQHPKLAMAYNIFGRQVLLESSLPVWPRELLTLRISWHMKAEYEWHYHVGYALNAGMTLEQVSAIRDGPDAPGWSEEDAAVLRAVDELWSDQTISDATWATLARHFSKHQLMDLVFATGNYVVMTWALNAFGVPVESDDPIGFDLRTRSGGVPRPTLRPKEQDDWSDNSGTA